MYICTCLHIYNWWLFGGRRSVYHISYIYICLCIYICIYVHVYIYATGSCLAEEGVSIIFHTYIYVYVYICVCIYVYVYIYTTGGCLRKKEWLLYFIHIYAYICVYTYIYICMYICTCIIHIYTYVFIYVYTHICIYMYMYVCIYVRVYMYGCYMYMYACMAVQRKNGYQMCERMRGWVAPTECRAWFILDLCAVVLAFLDGYCSTVQGLLDWFGCGVATVSTFDYIIGLFCTISSLL